MKLIVLKNNVPINEVAVDTADLTETYELFVGRSEDCHVQVEDPLISRHHFVLKNEGTKWYCEKITQLGTVTLNGSIVSKSYVKNGDEIKAGIYSFILSEISSGNISSNHLSESVLESAPDLDSEFEDLNATVILPTPVQAIPLEIKPETEIQSEPDSELLEDTSFEDDDIVLSDDISQELSNDLPRLDVLDNSSSEESNEFSEQSTEELSNEQAEDFGSNNAASEFDSGELTEVDDNKFEVSATDDSNESTRFFKAFVNYQLTLFGEHAPYDRYQIDKDEIFFGRDEKKCQIILNDPEVSSIHAVLKKTLNEIVLEDLNSSNGTILNGERINKAVLATGDEFVIGSTSFKLEVRSDLLDSESDRLMPVEKGQEVEVEEIVEEEISQGGAELNFDSGAPQEKSFVKRIMKDPKKRIRAFIAIGALGFMYLYLDEDTATTSETKPALASEAKKPDPNERPAIQLSKELQNRRNVAYELGVNYFEQGKYFEAENQFRIVVDIDSEYKKVQSYLEQTREALKRLAELEAQKRAEEDRIKMKKVVEELLVKARAAVEEKKVPVAESYFAQIIEKDPDNIEVSQLKLELESWQKEEERKALEKAAKETARKRMVDALIPGKTFYLKKEWYRAILKLDDFLQIKGMDEDLVKEASDMLTDSKNQLASDLGPLLGKARSLKEGQDYRSAYESFLEILKIEPTNTEALNEVDEIKSQLDARSKKIYREAIIAESLSLFGDAKEKFQEVQQISPTDSEYYKKATEKLRNYLE